MLYLTIYVRGVDDCVGTRQCFCFLLFSWARIQRKMQDARRPKTARMTPATLATRKRMLRAFVTAQAPILLSDLYYHERRTDGSDTGD